MEERHWVSVCGGTELLPSRLPLSAPPQVHQHGSSLSLILLGFYGGFITQAQSTQTIGQWQLMIELNIRLLLLPQRLDVRCVCGRRGLKFLML